MIYETLFQESIQNPEDFWMKQAQNISWFEAPEKALSQDEEGLYRWFKGGKMNTSYLALDYHIEQGRGDQTAIIYDSPVTDTLQKITFSELRDRVAKFAGGLQSLGVQKGDTVIIYMPMIPEAAVAMLACARLGAIHSVVFGGFAPHELAIRIDDAKPKAILTASCGIEIKKVIPYMPLVREAIQHAEHKPSNIVVCQREQHPAELEENESDWTALEASGTPVEPVAVDATDPLYILYTSGTTGVPKGIVRDNGGHAVALKFSMEKIYGTTTGEVYWAASDVGWVVGHSYIVYAPLINGNTTIVFEGKPIKTPDAGTFWRVIDQHKVSVFFTAPTAFRAIKKEDHEAELLKNYDISSLKRVFVAGERCDIGTYNWMNDHLQRPIVDHWWQTESGWPMLADMMGLEEAPEVVGGSAGKPVCGFNVRILDEGGHEVTKPNQEGFVAIKLPLPPGCLPTLWQNSARFKSSYLSMFDGFYLSGDGGYRDEAGNFFITGRIDDVINVAGHRLSTGEMEEMISTHEVVAECAVVGIEDNLKGQIPVGLVVLKDGVGIAEADLEKELAAMIRHEIGPIACYKQTTVVKRLPKTRSGKILRKTMRKIADGQDFKMPSTIDDPAILDEIREAFQEHKIGNAFQS